jgi:hypothetical protein
MSDLQAGVLHLNRVSITVFPRAAMKSYQKLCGLKLHIVAYHSGGHKAIICVTGPRCQEC